MSAAHTFAAHFAGLAVVAGLGDLRLQQRGSVGHACTSSLWSIRRDAGAAFGRRRRTAGHFLKITSCDLGARALALHLEQLPI